MSCEHRIDVSALEPPDPLVLTLEAAETLPAGCFLRMVHRRDPCLLYDNLRRRGFAWRHCDAPEAGVELLIWRAEDAAAAAAAAAAGASNGTT